MKKVKFEAIKFNQDGQTMFLAAPAMKDLLKHCKIDKWKPPPYLVEEDLSPEEYFEKQGYQREVTPNRIRQIVRYLISPKKKGTIRSVFPGSIILSSRNKKLNFIPLDQSVNVGTIEIDEEDIFYIIDGQHRFEGLKHVINVENVQEYENFEIPITIIECNNKGDEIEQFALINNAQKRIKTDLSDRLLKFLKFDLKRDYSSIAGLRQDDWKTRAVIIAQQLNSDNESPWYKRIRRPNEIKKTSREAVASESEFTKSLKPILMSPYATGDFDTANNRIYEIINEYWKAWRDLVPEAFENPGDYVLQKTTGFHALNKILPEVTMECSDLYGKERSKKRYSEILKRIENQDPDKLTAEYWKSGSSAGASTNVGMGPIYKLAEEILNDIQFESN